MHTHVSMHRTLFINSSLCMTMHMQDPIVAEESICEYRMIIDRVINDFGVYKVRRRKR